MANKNGGDIKFRVGFQVNQASLNELRKSLQDLQKIKPGDFKGNYQEFTKVKETVSQLEILMNKAFNPTLNTSNIASFRNELEKSGLSLKQIQSDLSQFGPAGQRAFNQMTTSVLTTNLKLKETNSLIDSMGKTMVNTVKWGIASSVMNTFTQSVQGAFQYVQSLEKSLTNIRIVTGDSTEKMAQFAEQANRSAQALGRSTLDYSKASLTFYQQGLNDEDVQTRTEATLKAQNITGAGAQMADYLTSVWNGYKVANEEAELYVDKLAAVADSSASDMSQLAVAMSKVASTANNMGVDVDQLNAQIATVVATTRQAPEAVGTAFKTIYTRMNDIKAGSDEAEISLGNYSGKMAELGVNVLDATGHLRDTGQVMDQIGERWSTMTKEQQVYLAQTMGGQRQVNQLMALFDNWTTYSELLNTSLEAEGTLAEKNSRYMESLGAKMEQLGAAGERVKASLIDSDSMKNVIDALTSVTNLAANLFETMGSGNTVLLAFGSSITQLFSGTIAKEINSIITNMQNVKSNAEAIRQELELTKEVQQVGKDTPGGTVVTDRLKEIQQYYSVLDQASINNYKNLLRQRGAVENEIQAIETEQKKVIDLTNAFKQGTVGKEDFVDPGRFGPLNDAIGDTQSKLRDVKDLFSKNLFENWNKIENIQDAQKLVNAVETFREEYQKINPDKAKQLLNDLNKLNSGSMSPERFGEKLQGYLDSADIQAKKLTDTINNSAQALSNATGKASSLDSALKQDVDSAKQLFDVTNATKFVGAVGQIASSIMTISNLKSIISDRDVSAGEKLAKILTTASFVFPTLVHSLTSISSATGITAALEERRLKINKKISLEQKLQTAQKQKQIALETYENLMEKAEDGEGISKAFVQVEEADKKIEKLKLTLSGVSKEAADTGSALSTAFSAAGSSVSSFIGVLGSIAVPLLAVSAVVVTGYALYKAYNQAADAAKKAAEEADNASAAYKRAKDSFKNLTSSIEDYSDAKSALSELVKGTEQWYNKIDELNDKVLQLLQTFPELANYITTTSDGILQISDKGLEEVRKTYRQRAYISGMVNADLQEKSYQAERNAKSIEEGRRIYGGFGMFGGKDTMDAVLAAIQKNGTNILGDRDALYNAVKEQGVQLNDKQLTATMENTTQIRNLVATLEAEKNQVGALRESLVKTNLNNEQAYRNSQNKEAFADIVSQAIKNQKANGLDQFQRQQIDMYGNVSKYLDPKAIIKRYEELSGNEVQQKGNEISVKQAGSDEFQKSSYDEIKAYVAEASINMEQIIADATERMANAEKKFAAVDERTKEVLFNSGLVGGVENVNTANLSKEDVNNLEKLNKNDLADYLGIDSSKVEEQLSKLKENIQTGLDNFIEGIEQAPLKGAMTKLREQYGDYLSEDLAKIIAQQIQSGYKNAGIEGGDTLRRFYAGLKGQQAKEISGLVEEYNFATGSFEDFKQAIRNSGVGVEQLSDTMIQKLYETQKKIQDIQTKEYKTDLGKVNEANSTTSLGTKLNEGQKLSDKELQSYKEGLQDILKIYPELNEQVNILNNTQLAGTKEYESALRDVKLALMSSYLAMGEMGKITSQDFTNQMMTLVTDTEMFQNLYQTGALNNQQFSTILQNLAVQYESCKDELAKYNTELRTGNEETQNAAAFNLMLATRSAENANVYGIQAQQISTLASHYVELAKSGDQAYKGMNQSSELAVDAATRYIRLNEAVQTLQKDYTKVSETLSALQNYDFGEVLGDADYAKTFVEIKKAVEGIIGVEEGLLDNDFIKQHADQIKEAAEGSEQAIIALQEAAAEEIWVNINLDDEKFREATQLSKQEFADWINNLPEGELDIDDTLMLEKLANTLLAAGYTLDDIQSMYEGAHLNIDMEADPSQVIEAAEQVVAAEDSMAYDSESTSSSQTQTDQQETGGYELIPKDQHGTFQIPVFRESVTPFGVVPQFGGMDSHSFTYTEFTSKPDKQSQDVSTVNTITGVKIKHANKAPVGGQVSHKNKNGGNRKNTGGGKGRGRGGGGGKGSQPKAAKTVDSPSKQKDRYRNVNVRAKRQASSLEKLKKQQEQLTGKDVTKNLNKQLDILKQQEKTIRSKLALQRQERDQLQNELKKYGAKFNKNTGTLNNYGAVFDKITKQYNKVIAWYNGLTGDQQDQQNNKTRLDNAKKAYDQAMKNLERYDKLNENEIQDTIKELNEKIQEEIDNQVQTFHIKIDAALDFTQARNNYQDFLRDIKYQIRDDDIIGLNKYTFNKLGNYYNKNQTGSIQQLRKQLDDAINNRGGIYSTVVKDEYGNRKTITDKAKQQADIKDLTQKLQKQLENYQDLIEDIKKSIFDIIDETDKAFKEQIDEYEYISDLIDHNVKVTQLLFGDDAYAQLERYYDKIEENNNAQLDFLRQRQQMWYGRMMQEQARMQSLDPTSNLYKEAQDRFKEYEKLWMESQKDLNSLVEKSIQDLQDKYANSIDNIFTQLELKWTKGLHLDTVEDEWDKINDLADMYLDKINGMYQIDKLENAFQDAIDNASDSLSAQQSLNELMNEQLGYLRDKDKLTQYDVDRANALLQIEIKRLALEQSRSNKTKLRLRRDSQGNYSYQYVANQQENNKAQQELADAQNSLYNTTKEATRNNLSDITKTVQEAKDKLAELYKDQNRDTEEWQIKKANLEQYYTNKINGLLEQNNQLRNDLMQDSFDQLAKMYGINAEQFNAMTEQQKNSIMTNLFPQWGSLAQQMADTLKAEGGFYQTIVGPIQEAAAANKDYYDGLNKIQLSSGQAFGAIVTGQDNLINKGKELLDHNDKLVNSWEDQIKAVQGTINKVNELSNAYINAKDNGKTIFQEIAKGYQKGSFASDLSILGTTGTADSTARKNEYYNQYGNVTKESQSKSDLKDYKDYQPESYTITNMRQLLKQADLTSSSIPGVLSSFDSNNKANLKTLIETTVDLNKQYNNINLDSILTSMDNKISNINLNIERLLADNINKLSEIKEVLVNNNNTIEQKVDIQATFPSLVEIKTIQDAFDNLVNRAAQSAGKNGL